MKNNNLIAFLFPNASDILEFEATCNIDPGNHGK